MGYKTVKQILLISVFVVALGYAINWWLAGGIGVGMLLCIWIYEYRYSIVDEVGTAIFWQLKKPWKDSEEPEYYEKRFLWWQPQAFLGLLIILVTGSLIVAGMLGALG